MKIEIDQSGKVEKTSKPTVIGFSNSFQRTILISAKEKQKLQREFRKIGKPKAFIYQTFNVMIFILIKDYAKKLDSIIIDKEYPGKEQDIKLQIYSLFAKHQITIEPKIIIFKEIGKKSNAHNISYLAYKKRKADIIISAKDVLKILLT